MPIKLMLHEGGQTGLVALCDVCGKRLHGNTGNVLWKSDDAPGHTVGETYDFTLTCKQCNWGYEQKHGHHYSQELGPGLVYLLNNCKVNLARAKQQAKWLSEL